MTRPLLDKDLAKIALPNFSSYNQHTPTQSVGFRANQNVYVPVVIEPAPLVIVN